MIDFSIAENIREYKLNIQGWKPLIVEYGFTKVSSQTFILWRIKKTDHTFRVPLKTVTSNHGYKYSEHFEIVLKQFREDLLSWIKQGLPEDWMLNYNNQFGHLLMS